MMLIQQINRLVFPAHAGMIREFVPMLAGICRIPRARGWVDVAMDR